MKHQVLMLPIFVILVLSLVPSTFAEESVNLAATTKATLQYSSSYDKMQADADTSITLQSDEHLYNPGDAGVVEGTISSNVITGLGEALSLITITVVDANGKIIAEEESEISDGEYFAIFTIPNDAAPGQYTVTSKIEADADVLDLIGLDATANLESSAKFMVAAEVNHDISVDDNDFEISIASNSKISNVEFEKEEKKISFMVEGETGTEGVAEVTIPTAMLSGTMSVMIDGQIVASDDVIVKSNTEVQTTFEINYHHSVHTIDIVGTQAVPEFPSSILTIMIVGTIAAVFLARTQTLHAPKI